MINKTDDKTIINDMRLLAINEAKIIVDSNKTSNTSILKFLILLKVKILISEKIKNFCIYPPAIASEPKIPVILPSQGSYPKIFLP